MRAKFREHNYQEVRTPTIMDKTLWEKSGHWDNYRDNMFTTASENRDYAVKPMNCPGHVQIFNHGLHSYRDLPLRLAEFGSCHRNESSGSLHGLMRVRGFTQDDAHHFCREDQMPEEIAFVLQFSIDMLKTFCFKEINAYLSTKPEKSVGEPKQWESAEKALEDTLIKMNVLYKVDKGGGAFYGPKIDLNVKDALGREWQLSTIQFDFNEPELFDLTYIGEDGAEHRPYMVHRALLGSLERFFGVLIEHYGGAFPAWLSPKQVAIIPIADRHLPFAREVAAKYQKAGLRVTVDERAERMNSKIRDAQNQKIPYMLVIGDREMEANQVALRRRNGENPGAMGTDEFLSLALREVAEKI